MQSINIEIHFFSFVVWRIFLLDYFETAETIYNFILFQTYRRKDIKTRSHFLLGFTLLTYSQIWIISNR
jgi:hypothetical protein